MTPETKNEIMKSFVYGITIEEMSEIYGISAEEIKALLESNAKEEIAELREYRKMIEG